jgi:Inner membrane component of T3SS, cytoplasmic domain
MKKSLLAGLLCLIALAAALPSAAQNSISVNLLNPNIEDFPRISAYLDVHSMDGFVHGLQPGNITIIEDGQQLPVVSLEELNPGVQFVIAITPCYAFDVRDGQGISRYEYLIESMSRGGWEDAQNDLDDFSLAIAGGPEVTHTADSAELLAAMRSFDIPHGEVAPDLEVLSRAIDIAADPTPQPGMERVVLFITSPLLSEATAGVQSLAGRAIQLGVRLFIWLVAPLDYFPLPGATQMRTIAEQSNGSYFGFSGSEDVPTLESYLEPLRFIYSLTYESRAATSGNHQFSVDVSVQGTQASSNLQNYSVEVAPPNPIFISPPSRIERTYSTDEEVDPQTLTAEDLIPVEQALKVRIEFPDGYERELVRTVLLIDGNVAAENSAPPFDVFTWDLSTYHEDGQHLIQVEATDQLGLSGKSIERSVQITVPSTTQSILTTLSRQVYLIAVLLALLILAFLALGMILSGRVRPRLIGRPESPRRKEPLMPVKLLKSRSSLRELREHPVENAVEVRGKSAPLVERAMPRQTIWQRLSGLLSGSKPKASPKAFALLIPLSEDGHSTPLAPFQIIEDEIAIGRDAEQAALTLDEPAVEPVHTRLVREGDKLRVLDRNTTAGTWVNYERIPAQGVLLEHGDLLHIGRVGFRFELREPSHQPKIVVIPLDTPDDDHES